MNRGVLKLTNTEAQELLKSLNLNNYAGTPLANKLQSIDLNNQEIEIFLSEDEIENILDEIGMVDPSSNQLLSSAMNKITKLLGSFHNNLPDLDSN